MPVLSWRCFHESGKPDPKIDPRRAEEMSKYPDMFVSGRREIFQVVEQEAVSPFGNECRPG
jgi:hypothetical protein